MNPYGIFQAPCTDYHDTPDGMVVKEDGLMYFKEEYCKELNPASEVLGTGFHISLPALASFQGLQYYGGVGSHPWYRFVDYKSRQELYVQTTSNPYKHGWKKMKSKKIPENHLTLYNSRLRLTTHYRRWATRSKGEQWKFVTKRWNKC